MLIRKDILRTPVFILAVLTLLLNDHVLKENFDNALIGKLSDFSGLLAFSLFLMALFPRQLDLMAAISATIFVFWKSPWSQGLIESWNELGMFSVGRIVDFTDLLALATIPLAILIARKKEHDTLQVPALAMLLLACVAFVATTMPRYYSDQTVSYTLPYSTDSLIWHLDSSGNQQDWGHVTTYDSVSGEWMVNFDYPSEVCDACSAWAISRVTYLSDSTCRLFLENIQIQGKKAQKLSESDDLAIKDEFENKVISVLD